MRERCFRTVLISPIVAPDASKARVSVRLSSNETPARGRDPIGRRAARHEHEHEIVGARRIGERKRARRRGKPGLVRHRMPGFDHFDPPQLAAIAVARDRDPADAPGRELERVEVMPLRRLGHAARGLARGEHDDAPVLRSRRQGGRQAVVGCAAATAA